MTQEQIEEFAQAITDHHNNQDEEGEEGKENEVENITEDGGITKRIIKEGKGWETPKKGSEVFVHYVGKLLDGSIFDSSRERDQPFSFKLGMGQVIKGWDKGVKEMKKGEVSILTIKPEYAYGASDSPKIPPNSTLEFEVELINFIEEEDISEKKDGSVLKKLLEDGGDEKSWEKPREESTVSAHILGKVLETQIVFEDSRKVNEGQPKQFTVGDIEIVEGLEKALLSMARKEKALITIKASAGYEEQGCTEKNIPPNSTLQFEIEMVDFTNKPWDLSFQDKSEMANRRKSEGNELYQRKKFERSSKRYQQALDHFASEHNLSDEEKKKGREFKVSCHLNLAACCLQTKNLKKVIEHTTKALEIESTNVKGLLRRGRAHLLNEDYELALIDLEKAKQLYPQDKEVEKELSALKRRIDIQNQKDRKKFANLFEKIRE